MDIIALFREIDDSFLGYAQYQAQHEVPEILGTGRTRSSPKSLHPGEVMTILVHFHHKRHKNFTHRFQMKILTEKIDPVRMIKKKEKRHTRCRSTNFKSSDFSDDEDCC